MQIILKYILLVIITAFLFVLSGCINRANNATDNSAGTLSDAYFDTIPGDLGEIFGSEWPEDNFE